MAVTYSTAVKNARLTATQTASLGLVWWSFKVGWPQLTNRTALKLLVLFPERLRVILLPPMERIALVRLVTANIGRFRAHIMKRKPQPQGIGRKA